MYTKYEQWLNEAKSNNLTGEAWLNAMGIENYTINTDLTVDVKGDVYIMSKILKNIPVQFGTVSGNFDCSHNMLTSLEGCPKEVGGDFYCSFNRLTSLEGGPKTVKRHFYCNDNRLTSLEGGPETVGGLFRCSKNNITSLKGAPKTVGGDFQCSFTKLTSLEGAPETVGGGFYCHTNKKQFTVEDVKKLTEVKGKISV